MMPEKAFKASLSQLKARREYARTASQYTFSGPATCSLAGSHVVERGQVWDINRTAGGLFQNLREPNLLAMFAFDNEETPSRYGRSIYV
jgi:hypothetical protein